MSAPDRRLEIGAAAMDARPQVRGKFLFVGDRKLHVCGATYGAFRPGADGNEYHDAKRIEADLARMAANGMTAVRIPHTTPPSSLLDLAQRHGLRVMVGLSVEQLVGYLIDKKDDAPDLEELVRTKVRACAGHPGLLCYALGNEIPASLVRWLGRRRVERFLERMFRVVKQEDPAGLVTYVNYPTTEYLDLPFLDLVCFNVYLESREQLEAYLARLQNLAGDRPLIMSELGLDALRNGELAQAKTLDWQVRASFAGGCAGVFVFSWTDEWYRGGADVEDWAFGLTDRARRPKPALRAVRKAFEAALKPEPAWPSMSVVVCSHDGRRTIRDCCEGLRALDYPDFEVIVVDDGSTDGTGAVASEYGFRVIRTPHRGLSSARNTGLAAARGEVVAYLDDDAYPDPHWLRHLATTFCRDGFVGVGGPNLTPPDDGPIARCVGNSPGNPTHVLLSDEEAEHLPGCNMAFRRAALEAIGGFDPRFRTAGDDVDVCWRLRGQGGRLGFSPAAVVWHHRRASVRAYLRQQVGYGRAEAQLAAKWPDQDGPGGRIWHGRIYGAGVPRALSWLRPRIYHGVWGHAPFQSLYERAPGTLLSLPVLPGFSLFVLALLGVSVLGALWRPLLLALPLLVLASSLLVGQALLAAARAWRRSGSRETGRLRWIGVTTCLHLLQPLARLWGWLQGGAEPRRPLWQGGFALPWPRMAWIWSERWLAPERRLEALESVLAGRGLCVVRGGDYDGWDLEVRGGPWGAVRACLAVEDHGGGSQLVRLRTWPRVAPWLPVVTVTFAALAAWACWDRAWEAAGLLGSAAAALALLGAAACASASATWAGALEGSDSADE